MKKIVTLIKKINTNLLVASSAVFISFCALFISVQEMKIMRVQQKASMYPYLTLGWVYNSEGFGVELKNSGNGLAKINSYKVFNDSVYFKEWLQVIKTYMPESNEIGYGNITTAGNIRNLMISPNETKKLIFINWNDETRMLHSRLENLEISVSYESLLDEHWIIKDGIPVEIESKNKIKIVEEFGI
ncbi:hypothetical protein [Polaribacter porphyrae]|uniref:Uncharacterized protein n=1 Tax=Polaribacter porphyrae TaxID=1137780 RepID=A0A2S7WRR4_9FLAO|nr:hypothetical protein [Polaribacter porphyrae]PQJ80002.1 hypothetical protein BTO18_12845 [Polaribacter porphyrae]